MKEDGHDETPPLIWHGAVGKLLAVCKIEVYIWHAAKAT
jgi:hypothetical protein